MVKIYSATDNVLLFKAVTAGYVALGILITFCFKLKGNSLVLLFIVAMILCACITALFGPNYRINDMLLIFCYFGIALIPVYYKLNHKLFLWFAYILALFFVPFLIANTDPNDVFNPAYASRNIISCVLLIGLAYHIIACFQNNKTPNFILITLSFLIAIWAIGRGGIIAIGFIWIAYPFMLKIKRRYQLLMLAGFIVLALFVFFSFKALLLQYGLGRFVSMGMGGERENINADYLQATFHSVRNFLFGCPLNEIPTLVALGIDPNFPINPHNGIIRAHVYYGIGGLLLIVFMSMLSAYKFFTTHSYSLLVLFMALFMRSMVDSISFHGSFDTMIYALIFYAIKDYRVAKVSKVQKSQKNTANDTNYTA
jgi:hypothetical protein